MKFCTTRGLPLTRYRPRLLDGQLTYLLRHPTREDSIRCLQRVLDKKSLDTPPTLTSESS